MQVIKTGSVRVDLVGGTLDLEPINLILKNVVTLNVATGLKARVVLEETNFEGIEITSDDYDKVYRVETSELTEDNVLYSKKFAEMTFVLQIVQLFNLKRGLKINLSSGAPAGSGLGGSSAMGVTLYKALCEWTKTPYDVKGTVRKVKAVESRILNQGVAGYQDYFPALMGGVLALRGIEGDIEIEQLFTPELKQYLEENISLIYSGQSRASGINNWEVYKGFFDHREEVVKGMKQITEISHGTYIAIKEKDYSKVLSLIAQEGEERERLFPHIMTDKIRDLKDNLRAKNPKIGIKMCGAGGGGCFILIHRGMDKKILTQELAANNMKELEFKIEAPLT